MSRQNDILNILKREPSVKTSDLIKEFGIAKSTLSADLNTLRSCGYVIDNSKRGYLSLVQDKNEATLDTQPIEKISKKEIRKWFVIMATSLAFNRIGEEVLAKDIKESLEQVYYAFGQLQKSAEYHFDSSFSDYTFRKDLRELCNDGYLKNNCTEKQNRSFTYQTFDENKYLLSASTSRLAIVTPSIVRTIINHWKVDNSRDKYINLYYKLKYVYPELLTKFSSPLEKAPVSLLPDFQGKYPNSYERLVRLLSFLTDSDFEKTAENIAKHLQVSTHQILQDIHALQANQITNGFITTKEQNGILTYHTDFDLTSFLPVNHIDVNKHYKLLTLLAQEHYYCYMLSSYDNSYLFPPYYDDWTFDCFIEKAKTPSTYIDPDDLAEWDFHIQQNNTLLIKKYEHEDIYDNDYDNDSDNNDGTEFIPHFIKQDIHTKQHYAIQVDLIKEDLEHADSYPLLTIPVHLLHILKATGTDNNGSFFRTDAKLIRYINCLWSLDENDILNIDETEPIHIKIKFYDDGKGLIDAIKKELEIRSETATISGPFPCSNDESEYSNFYYYEDDILGKETFQIWLQQFKELAVVIEPTDLMNNEITSSWILKKFLK